MSVSIQYLANRFATSYHGPIKWGNDLLTSKGGVYMATLPFKTNEFRYNAEAIDNWIVSASLTMTKAQIVTLLSSYWLHDETIVYIGSANHMQTIRNRVYDYYGTPLGVSKGRYTHAGGEWIKTLKDLNEIEIYWIDDIPSSFATPALLEDAMITEFATVTTSIYPSSPRYPGLCLPYANRKGKYAGRSYRKLPVR